MERAQQLIGRRVRISGMLHTRNITGEDGKSHLELYVSGSMVDMREGPDNNWIYLEGYVCKKPIYRETPLGKNIADLFVAVHRGGISRESDYIPCIFWNKMAKRAAEFEVGDQVKFCGRIQSRTYQKTKADGTVKEYTAVEVSAMQIVEVIKKEEVATD